MATGVYGTIRPADVSIDDMEIFLHFTPSRDTIGDTELTKIDPRTMVSRINNPNNENGTELFGGMYTLNLPTNLFGQKGIYTLIIKPIEIRTRIVDCGVLSAFPNIKGLVFDTAEVDNEFISRFQNGNLSGYRIEYLGTDGDVNDKIPNLFTIVTSNNKAEPVNQNLTNSNQKAIRYRFNDNSSLVFATVTPSSVSNVKPNVVPFIGEPNQQVIITNTFFNPVMVEIEMVEYDVESLAIGLFGAQTKSLEDGVYTIYNFDEQIFKQYNLFEIKDQFTGKPLYEVREPRTNIDFLKNFDDIINL
jgi:hypothetical protein